MPDGSGCFVLVLSKTVPSQIPAADALQEIGERPEIITLSDSDAPRLQRLVSKVARGAIQGMLVVVFPTDLPRPLLDRLLTFPSHRGMVSLERANQSAKNFTRFPLHSGLALADRHARNRKQAVVVADIPRSEAGAFAAVSVETQAPSVLPDIPRPEPDGNPAEMHSPANEPAHKFRIVSHREATQTFLYSLHTHQRFGFKPYASKAEVREVVRSFWTVSAVKKSEPLQEEIAEIIHEWAHQDFAGTEATVDVLNMAVKAFPLRKEMRIRLEWLNFLGALRMAQRMASWNIEGEPFECSILLVDSETCKKLASMRDPRVMPLISLPVTLPFNFSRLADVRDYAETAQSDELLMVVDAKSCELRHIAVVKKVNENNELKLSRYDWFSYLAQENHIVLHVRTGFVEVYLNNELAIWHDGFEWLVKPFETLASRIRVHLERISNELHRRLAIERLMSAVAALMDSKKGSTFVLLDERDDRELTDQRFRKLCPQAQAEPDSKEPVKIPATRFDFYAGTSLRGELNELSEPIQIASIMSPRTLMNMLRLDGAHAITHLGELKYIARRINVRVDDERSNEQNESAQEVPEDADPEDADQRQEDQMKKSGGTGTRAAKWLSGRLRKSTVIRVSASGSLRIFKNGKEVRKPSPGSK